MKKLMTAFFMVLTGIALNAQDTSLVQPPMYPPYSEQEAGREKIQMRDLPETVRESLKEPDYDGWTMDAAYKALVSDPERPESAGLLVYIVEVKRGDERAIIRFDKEGKRLDENDQK